MRVLLDTNICIYVIKQKPPEVFRRLAACQPDDVVISSITVAELEYGVAKSQRPEQNRKALQQFLTPLLMAPFDGPAAEAYGSLRTWLERQGTPIGPLDMLIAAHAVSLGLSLVSNNPREFERVPGLNVENWVVGDAPKSPA